MIKFVAEMDKGNLYGFGLTEANLNRLEFNKEPIFFDFGYTSHPELFGLILYLGECKEPTDIAANLDAATRHCLPFFDSERGVTPQTLCFFPLAQSIMQKFRSTPFWGFETHVAVTSPSDKQMFFAGRTEQEIEQYFQASGLIAPQTKRTYKGFGKEID